MRTTAVGRVNFASILVLVTIATAWVVDRRVNPHTGSASVNSRFEVNTAESLLAASSHSPGTAAYQNISIILKQKGYEYLALMIYWEFGTQ